MKEKFGPEEFSYMPETLVIPRYAFGINKNGDSFHSVYFPILR